MFSPDRDDVRKFFAEAWQKNLARAPLSPLESMAVDIVTAHPEYHKSLASGQSSMQDDYAVEQGGMNPFLHLSLHLAIEEQLSIDQPAGLRVAFGRILAKSRDRHAALHAVLECLGETVWRSQREAKPLDAQAYLECVRMRCKLKRRPWPPPVPLRDLVLDRQRPGTRGKPLREVLDFLARQGLGLRAHDGVFAGT